MTGSDAGTSADRTRELTPSLILSLRKGDPTAGALLDEIYREALMRLCWGYLRNTDEAEDAVQEVCCKALAATEVPDRFRVWLYQIARNHCVNILRRRGRRGCAQELPPASQFGQVLTGQLTRLAALEERGRLPSMVAKLSEAHQEVLRLRYVEDLTRGEVAEILGVAESVVKSRLFEGLKRLRELAADVE